MMVGKVAEISEMPVVAAVVVAAVKWSDSYRASWVHQGTWGSVSTTHGNQKLLV